MNGPGILPEYLSAPADGSDVGCWVCGVGPRRGDAPNVWAEPSVPDPRGPWHRIEVPDGWVQEFEPQGWRQRHLTCVGTGAGVLAKLTGVALDDHTAETIVQSIGVPLSARAANRATTRPYGWLTKDDRALVAEAVERAVESTRPHPSPVGRCAMCGVGKSVEWTPLSGGWRWQDGRAGLGCDTCTTAMRQVADPGDPEGCRIVALALAAGMRPTRMLRPVARLMRLACEVVSTDERHDDDAEPWTYGPKIAALAFEARWRNPGAVLDPEVRAEAVAELARREAEVAAKSEADSLAAFADAW